MHMCPSTHSDVRGQFAGVVRPYGFEGSNSGHQAERQVPLPTEYLTGPHLSDFLEPTQERKCLTVKGDHERKALRSAQEPCHTELSVTVRAGNEHLTETAQQRKTACHDGEGVVTGAEGVLSRDIHS